MAALIVEDTVDDLLHSAFQLVLSNGEYVEPTQGPSTEVRAVTLELRNPRARLSRSLERGRILSPLGELCWYLSGSNSADSIAYYLKYYSKIAEDGVLPGAYGPRLFGEVSQVHRVIALLRQKPQSRRAVIPILRSTDFEGHHDDLPCTVSLQFFLRGGRLDLVAHMRSSDLFTGFIHDVFCFTMIQEIVAVDLGVELGSYTHFAASLHVYKRDLDHVQRYLDEGWQSTREMPSMPPHPWEGVAQLLSVETALRENGARADCNLPNDPYWSDLARLLRVFGCLQEGDDTVLSETRSELQEEFYQLYLDDKIVKAEARGGIA